MDFGCEVFGLQFPKSGTPNVEMEIRLLHDGAPVYDSPIKPVQPAVVDGETLLGGTIALAANLEPGNYTIQLVAYDRLAATGRQMALQQADLTIVKPSELRR